jgi:hypothetical protein
MKAYIAVAAVLAAMSSGLTGTAHAQTFKVSKFSIGGEGGHDYIVAEPGGSRVFVSRETHFMVVEGATGKVVGDIGDLPGVHGVALVPKWNHGFTTNRGDSTVTMFDLKTLAAIKKIPVTVGGLDGIMYDDSIDRVILTNHSRPVGTAVAIDPNTGEITGSADLEDDAPEGAASDGAGKLFVNNESKNTIQVLEAKTMTVLASWPIAPWTSCGSRQSGEANLLGGATKTSVVIEHAAGKSSRRHGWRRRGSPRRIRRKLIYIPPDATATSQIVHQIRPTSTPSSLRCPRCRAARPLQSIQSKHGLMSSRYGATPAPALRARKRGAGQRPPAPGP